MKAIAAQIDKLSVADLERLESGQTIAIDGETISISDVEIKRSSLGAKDNILVHQKVSIEVDTSLSDEQILEGLSREVTRKVQQARKNADLKLDARIGLCLFAEGKLLEAIRTHEKTLTSETLANTLEYASTRTAVHGQFLETTSDIEEGEVTIGITVFR